MYSSTLPLSSALDEMCQPPRPGRFTPLKDPVPIVQEAGWAPGPVWTGAENLAPTGIRSSCRPACSDLLYLLSYTGLLSLMLLIFNKLTHCLRSAVSDCLEMSQIMNHCSWSGTSSRHVAYVTYLCVLGAWGSGNPRLVLEEVLQRCSAVSTNRWHLHSLYRVQYKVEMNIKPCAGLNKIKPCIGLNKH